MTTKIYSHKDVASDKECSSESGCSYKNIVEHVLNELDVLDTEASSLSETQMSSFVEDSGFDNSTFNSLANPISNINSRSSKFTDKNSFTEHKNYYFNCNEESSRPLSAYISSLGSSLKSEDARIHSNRKNNLNRLICSNESQKNMNKIVGSNPILPINDGKKLLMIKDTSEKVCNCNAHKQHQRFLHPKSHLFNQPYLKYDPSIQTLNKHTATNNPISKMYSYCTFCKNNGESEAIYSTHFLKNSQGIVTCPILRAYTCPICGQNGDNAHTVKYCPVAARLAPANAAPRSEMRVLRTARTSAGRRRFFDN
ncbi:MAG: cerebellar neuron development [Paramarteilia canceri]